MTDTKRWRRDLRVPGYDYATSGTYFVTVCVQNRACILGNISDGESHLSPAGTMVENHLYLAMDRYPDVEPDAHIVMPNHLHALIRFGCSVDAAPGDSLSEQGRHGGLQLREGVSAFARVCFQYATSGTALPPL